MAINWTKLFKEYNGQWVALKDDEKTVIASGKTAKDALAKSKAIGFAQPILTRVPQELTTYVGSF